MRKQIARTISIVTLLVTLSTGWIGLPTLWSAVTSPCRALLTSASSALKDSPSANRRLLDRDILH